MPRFARNDKREFFGFVESIEFVGFVEFIGFVGFVGIATSFWGRTRNDKEGGRGSE